MKHTILTEPADTQGLRHACPTIVLHWATALLVVALWCIGQTIDWVPRGPLRVDYLSLHLVFGVSLGCILVARLAWRIGRGGMLPPLDTGLLLAIARVTHWILYALLILAVGLGIANAWVHGDSVFNLFKIPQFDPGNRALMHRIGEWHALAANAVLIVAGLHAAAALFHHYVLRDATLRRMLPWELR